MYPWVGDHIALWKVLDPARGGREIWWLISMNNWDRLAGSNAEGWSYKKSPDADGGIERGWKERPTVVEGGGEGEGPS